MERRDVVWFFVAAGLWLLGLVLVNAAVDRVEPDQGIGLFRLFNTVWKWVGWGVWTFLAYKSYGWIRAQ